MIDKNLLLGDAGLRKPMLIASAFVLVAVVMGMLGLMAGAQLGQKGGAASALEYAKATITAQAEPPVSTLAQKTWHTTAQFRGDGDFTSGYFLPTSPRWRLTWTCKPNNYPIDYTVAIDIYYTGGEWADPGAVNALCVAGIHGVSGGSTYIYNVEGWCYLSVVSEYLWSITIESYS